MENLWASLIYAFGMIVCDVTVMITYILFSGLEFSSILRKKEKIKLFHVALFTLSAIVLILLSYFLLTEFPTVYIVGSCIYILFSIITFKEDRICAWLLFAVGFARILAFTPSIL